MRFLVIEDDATNFALLKGMLPNTAQITHAETFAETKRLLATEEFDIVLSDMGLPDCPFELFHAKFPEIRKLCPTIPIIVITGSGSESAGVETLKLGAQDYLMKGEFGKKQLLRAIRYAFERKHAEESLREAKAWSELVLGLVPSAVFTVNTEQTITSWNREAEVLTGYSAAEVIGQKCYKFVLHPCTERCGIMCSDVAKPVKNKECQIRRKDGELRYISKNADLLRNAKGEVVGGVESFEDITDRKHAEESREEIERIIRHDLKAPIIGVKGMAELLKDIPNLSSEQLECVKLLDESGDHMLDMINMSLILYKIEQGVYTPTTQRVDLVSKVKHLLADHRRLLTYKRTPVRITVDNQDASETELFTAVVDPFICRIMLSNLLTNAVEASPPGKTIKIDFSRNAGGVRIVIENAGAAPTQIRGHFFEKYATFGKNNGTGLGTYSARLSAKAQGGDIALSVSDATDTTTLTITLPHA